MTPKLFSKVRHERSFTFTLITYLRQIRFNGFYIDFKPLSPKTIVTHPKVVLSRVLTIKVTKNAADRKISKFLGEKKEESGFNFKRILGMCKRFSGFSTSKLIPFSATTTIFENLMPLLYCISPVYSLVALN